MRIWAKSMEKRLQNGRNKTDTVKTDAVKTDAVKRTQAVSCGTACSCEAARRMGDKELEKSEIRRMVKERRSRMPQDVLQRKSQVICEAVMGLDVFHSAGIVLAYMDCKGEVSTRPLLDASWRLGKRVAAPRVEGENMRYYYISSYADVADGYFHVPEPVEGCPACGVEAEDAILLVPGVGFDGSRNRCGYGKGFYDRYLAAHTRHATVALAFDFQIVEEIPTRPEDIRPQILVTESGIRI